MSRRVGNLPAGFQESLQDAEEEEQRRGAASTDEHELLEPRAERDVRPVEPTKRTGDMTGLLGLFDISKPGGSVLLRQLEKRLSEDFPGLSFEYFTKPTFSRPAPAQLRAEVAGRCRYVVAALAD